MMPRHGYMLAKILDKKYADALLDGQVFMRALQDFNRDALRGPTVYTSDDDPSSPDDSSGDSGSDRSAFGNAQEGVQLDPCEGMLGYVDPGDMPPEFHQLLAKMPDEIRAKAHNPFYSETNILPYLHLYCMYGICVYPDIDHIVAPDERLVEFGDTAVLMLDSTEFISRAVQAIHKRFDGKASVSRGFVEYLPDDDLKLRDEFCKRDTFRWQSEFRISAGHLTIPLAELSPEMDPAAYLVRDTETWTLEIGSIRDIAIATPTEKLLRLDFSDVPGGIVGLRHAGLLPKFIMTPGGIWL